MCAHIDLSPFLSYAVKHVAVLLLRDMGLYRLMSVLTLNESD